MPPNKNLTFIILFPSRLAQVLRPQQNWMTTDFISSPKFFFMKSKILLSAILLLFATFSFAQAQGDSKKMTVDEKVKKTMSQLTPQLALDNDQQAKMQAIYTDYYTAKEKLYEGLQPGAQPDKAQKEKLVNERDEKIKAVLNQDQYKKFKDWEEQMKQKKDKPGSDKPGS
jgi:hypothetical protein